MRGAPTKLAVLDTDTGAWVHHPWPEVHARAENVAERIAGDGVRAMGLVGDPTVEFIAAIPGVFFAGAAVSILPGPVRRSDPQQWAHATLDRFRSIGVTTVFSHGAQLEQLRGRDDAIAVHDLDEVGHARRSTTFHGPERADVAILQGTVGSTGTPRTAQISPAASLANLRGLITRINVDHRCRFHSWLPIYHDMGLAFVLVATLGQADLWQAPTPAFAGNPFSWLKWLTESRATMTAAPNMAFNLTGKYASSLSGFDLSNLGFTLNGGEPVDCEDYQRFSDEMARFGFDPTSLAPSYGLAESTCAVTIPEPFSGLRVDDVTVATEAGEATRRYAVLGHPIPGMEVRVNTDQRHATEVTGRDVGEIEIRGRRS
jgi:long-chain-fatty-acid--[acyl-carrier-protein] ligase